MLAITRTLSARVTCIQRSSRTCHRTDHSHHTPTIEVLTFVLDGSVPVHIERADDAGLYHVKIGEYTDLFKTEGQIITLLEAQ